MGRHRGEVTTYSRWSRADVPDVLPWDVYWEHPYSQAFAGLGDGTPGAFKYQHSDQTWFHVFLRRPIHDTGFTDLKTPYGYGGPLATTSDPDFLADAQTAFHTWAAGERIVTEFIRFHPLLATQQYRCAPETLIEKNRPTVWINLRRPWPDLLTEMTPNFRRGVRKGLAAGLICEEVSHQTGLPEFITAYHATMSRVGARAYYLFSPEHFSQLGASELGLRLFRVHSRSRSHDRGTAWALLLSGNEWCHYHLGASDPSALALRPNNVLFFGLLEALSQEGKCAGIHFGGGTTPDPDNSLFRFKASLGHDRAWFCTGKTVFLPEAHHELATAFPSDHSSTDDQGPPFPRYRIDDRFSG